MRQLIGNVICGLVISSTATSIASAQELFAKLTVTCPAIGTTGGNAVQNLGNFLAGNGSMRLDGSNSEQSLFEGPIVQGAKIPKDLGDSGYQNFGVSYNPSNGAVTCYYQSNQGFDPFALGHVYVNSLGGIAVSSTSNQIHFKIPVGLG